MHHRCMSCIRMEVCSLSGMAVMQFMEVQNVHFFFLWLLINQINFSCTCNLKGLWQQLLSNINTRKCTFKAIWYRQLCVLAALPSHARIATVSFWLRNYISRLLHNNNAKLNSIQNIGIFNFIRKKLRQRMTNVNENNNIEKHFEIIYMSYPTSS